LHLFENYLVKHVLKVSDNDLLRTLLKPDEIKPDSCTPSALDITFLL